MLGLVSLNVFEFPNVQCYSLALYATKLMCTSETKCKRA